MTSASRKKIAILGGGVAALTAALELTEQDPDQSQYDITIYTLGWRLGGKCASRRDMDNYGRAYEHGLHVWAGFYDNAFHVIQILYKALGEDEGAWGRCFEPLNHFTVTEYVGGHWLPWLISAPTNDLDPGIDGAADLSPFSLFTGFLSFLEQALKSSDIPVHLNADARSRAERAVIAVYPGRVLGKHETILSVVREFVERMRGDRLRFPIEKQRALVAVSREQTLAAVASGPHSDDLRRLGIVVDLAYALVDGLLSEEVLFGGFDAIDGIEWSKWMHDHGCSAATLQSAIVRGCYDYVFARGAGGEPSAGAGTATLALLRFLLTFKGSVLYALKEPMGDCLMVPFYQVLKKRGVSFEFFCKVTALHLADDAPLIDEIVFDRQVEFQDDVSEYFPLVENQETGGWTWPNGPIASQIKDGISLAEYDLESAWTDWTSRLPDRRICLRSAKAREMCEGVFDVAILATGFGGLEATCADLADRYPDTWGQSLKNIETIQTFALQLWLYPQTEDLGWDDPQTMVTAFETPDDVPPSLPSWEDNTRLLALERPRETISPRSLAYFVGMFPDADYIPPPTDHDFPNRENARARQAVVDWMRSRLTSLWPGAAKGSDFDWSLLEAPDGASGETRLDYQYLRPNINPWDRYVLSTPGTLPYRIQPDGSGVENFYLAGDWVRSGLNAGCVEAAVIAGRMVARSITGANIMITGDGNSNQPLIPFSALPLLQVLRKLKDHTAGGAGQMDAYCVTILAVKKDVQAMLPPGLSLMSTDLDTDLERPVVLLFTRQSHVRPGFVAFGGINYHEFIEIIPNVCRDDLDAPGGGPFSYMPYLVLDQFLPVLLGVNLYGYNKRLGRIADKGGSFDVQCDLGQIRTWLKSSDLPGGIDDNDDLRTVCDLVEHPLISINSTGTWIYSRLDYCLDTAEFQPIDGSVVITDPFIPNGGTPLKYAPSAIPWFRFSTHWTLTLPLVADRSKRSVVPSDVQDFARALRSTAMRTR